MRTSSRTPRSAPSWPGPGSGSTKYRSLTTTPIDANPKTYSTGRSSPGPRLGLGRCGRPARSGACRSSISRVDLAVTLGCRHLPARRGSLTGRSVMAGNRITTTTAPEPGGLAPVADVPADGARCDRDPGSRHLPSAHAAQACVVVPAFNEERSVARVVRGIRDALPSSRVVVVDDGSTDDTAAQATAAGAAVVSLPVNVGIG